MKSDSQTAIEASGGEADWKQFEKSVANFLSAHSPAARVTHDHRQIDPDTGSLRQRDVWIEFELCGLIQIKVLVSCKRWGKKLFGPDVEHFYGELLGAGAHLGLLYSHSGFGDTAVPKAQLLGRGQIHCCQLYSDEQTDIPEALILKQCFCAASVPQIALVDPPAPELGIVKWGDVFSVDPTVTERIQQAFQQLVEHARNEVKQTPGFPFAYQCELWFSNTASATPPIKVRLTLAWNFYEGDVEATLLNGTYCLTNGQFAGSQATPVIDMQGPHPGPAWKLLDHQPQFPSTGLIAVLFGPIADAAMQSLSDKPVKVLPPGLDSL
jgi:hypothetical protein